MACGAGYSYGDCEFRTIQEIANEKKQPDLKRSVNKQRYRTAN